MEGGGFQIAAYEDRGIPDEHHTYIVVKTGAISYHLVRLYPNVFDREERDSVTFGKPVLHTTKTFEEVVKLIAETERFEVARGKDQAKDFVDLSSILEL